MDDIRLVVDEELDDVIIEVEPLYKVTVSKTGNGTIFPDGEGDFYYSENEISNIFALPDAGYIFEDISVNGTGTITNPLAFNVLKPYDLTVNFISLGGILIPQIKVFDSSPVLKGNKYYFGDHSTKDNDVLVKNIMVGTFSQTAYVNTNMYILGQTPINFKISYEPANVALTKYLLVSKTGLAGSKGIFVNITNLWALNITISNGTSQQTIIVCDLQSVVNHDIEIDWNGLAGSTITVTVNGVIYTFTALYEWVGNSATLATIGFTSGSCEGKVSHSKLLNGANYFEYVFNHGQGSVIYNILGGANGTLTGAVLSTFWGSTSDYAVPFDLTLGATLYQNNSDQTIMPICFDTSQAIAGFLRLEWLLAGSGILRGLSNKYNIPISISGMSAGDYNEAGLRALVESDYINKTEGENTISLLEGMVLE